jgi:hypothetical protein
LGSFGQLCSLGFVRPRSPHGAKAECGAQLPGFRWRFIRLRAGRFPPLGSFGQNRGCHHHPVVALRTSPASLGRNDANCLAAFHLAWRTRSCIGTTAFLPAALRARGLRLFLPLQMRGGGAPRGANFAALARRGVHRAAVHSPSRRSTLAIFGPGTRASHSGIGAEACSESSSQPGRSTRPSLPRTSRARGCEPRPQDAKPRSAFRIASRTRPLIER